MGAGCLRDPVGVALVSMNSYQEILQLLPSSRIGPKKKEKIRLNVKATMGQ